MEPLSGGDSGDSGDEATGNSGSESGELDDALLDPVGPIVSPLVGGSSVWDEDELASLRTAESSPAELGEDEDVASKMLKMSVNSEAASPSPVYQTVPMDSPSSTDSDCVIQGESQTDVYVAVVVDPSNDQATGIDAEALESAL